jgi:hypothetical protein
VSALRGEVKGKWRLSLCAYKIGVSTVRAAFAIVHQCRRLPVLLETFLGSFPLFVGCGSWLNVCADGVRSSFHMIEYEIGEYMARYEVR